MDKFEMAIALANVLNAALAEALDRLADQEGYIRWLEKKLWVALDE